MKLEIISKRNKENKFEADQYLLNFQTWLTYISWIFIVTRHVHWCNAMCICVKYASNQATWYEHWLILGLVCIYKHIVLTVADHSNAISIISVLIKLWILYFHYNCWMKFHKSTFCFLTPQVLVITVNVNLI